MSALPRKRLSRELMRDLAQVVTGEDPAAVGTALGSLVAGWLAGYRRDDPAEQAELRERMLRRHIDTVREFLRREDDHAKQERPRHH
jgi:hypothetical protein